MMGLLDSLFGTVALAVSSQLQGVCAHNGQFHIYGTNTAGWGTCDICGSEVQIAILFNNLAHRLLDLEARLNG